MTVYLMGKAISTLQQRDIPSNHFPYKNRYFVTHYRGWGDVDRAIVNGLFNGKRMCMIAAELGMDRRYLSRIAFDLRKSKQVKNNIELVEVAFREGVIEGA